MKLRSLVGLAVVSAGLCACGGDDANDDPNGSEMSSAGAPSGEAGPLALNGCKASSFVDMTEADERVVEIAAEGLKFTPPCLSIAAGQSVRFEGSLTAHPLSPGNPDDAEAGSPNSPIAATSSGNSVEFTFENPGTYPYYCELHAFGTGMGMAGAIYVQ